MNLKMKTLAAAMIAAGTLGTAQASQILFPYVVNSSTVTTIVTVINTNEYRGMKQRELHWVLWYKDGANAEKNDAACIEVNQWLPTSSYDMQTVDLGGKFGSTTKGVLFNDPSINNDWKGTGKNFAMANLAAKPMRGYLLIDDGRDYIKWAPAEDAAPEASIPEQRFALEGEAMVFEFATGASWGYTAGREVGKDRFANDRDITFTAQNVSIKPWGETTTKYFVTPIDQDMLNGNNAADPKKLMTIFMGSEYVSAEAMFDRDENPVSGRVPQGVNCVGAVNAESLITGAAKNLLPDGGWGLLDTLKGQATNTKAAGYDYDEKVIEASVIKLDYNSKPTFNGEAVVGTFNNAFQLR